MNKPNRIFGLVEVDTGALQADDTGASVPSDIEILRVGDWSNTPGHGGFKVSAGDLDQYVENFNAGVRKGIPIDVEHRTDPVYGKRAIGWVQQLKRAGDSLIGTVQWTKTGLGLLQDGAYKYFSPEFVVSGYKDPEGKLATDRNVLVAGGITNRPLFKGLQAIMASDGSDNLNVIYADEGENDSMTLDEIRKKALADLNEDDKKVLADSKDQLTEVEKVAYGLTGTPPIGAAATPPVAAPTAPAALKAGKETVVVKADDGTSTTISASDFADLKLAAERGNKAYQDMQLKTASDTVQGWIKADDGSSKFKSGAKDKLVAFYNSLSESQQQVFASDVVPNIQTVAVAAGEIGQLTAGEMSADAAAEALDVEATRIMASDEGKAQKLSYSQALSQARVNKPDLAAQYAAGQTATQEA